jgi:hypothetical protein
MIGLELMVQVFSSTKYQQQKTTAICLQISTNIYNLNIRFCAMMPGLSCGVAVTNDQGLGFLVRLPRIDVTL